MKDLNYYKENAEEDYITTPISVLRYISELETELAIEDKKVCDECGYVEDMIAVHYEECSKLDGDYMCVNCGGGFDEVITDEERDADFCKDCYERNNK